MTAIRWTHPAGGRCVRLCCPRRLGGVLRKRRQRIAASQSRSAESGYRLSPAAWLGTDPIMRTGDAVLEILTELIACSLIVWKAR